MKDLVGEILEVLAKWSKEVDYETHKWDGKELTLSVRIKSKPTKKEIS